jgi:hypothetical protein
MEGETTKSVPIDDHFLTLLTEKWIFLFAIIIDTIDTITDTQTKTRSA